MLCFNSSRPQDSSRITNHESQITSHQSSLTSKGFLIATPSRLELPLNSLIQKEKTFSNRNRYRIFPNLPFCRGAAPANRPVFSSHPPLATRHCPIDWNEPRKGEPAFPTPRLGISFSVGHGAIAGKMNNWRKIILWAVIAAVGAACIAWSYRVRFAAEARLSTQAAFARDEAQRIQDEMILFTEQVVPAGRPFAAILQGLGIAPRTAAQLTASAQPVFDLRHLRAGNRLEVGRSVFGDLREVRYRIDTDRVLTIAPKGNDFHSEIETIPSETAATGVTGEIRGSLFEGVIDAGEKPDLAMRLADIFGWDLDFYTDPRPGDTFRVVVEKKKLSNGEFGGYGRILAAEYVNGGRPYRAVLFHDPEGNPAYYTPEGKSLKKAFLHSPLKFAAPITSHFSTHRFHPILKEYRPHLGIDYGAPTGTPVQTIGDGRVIFAARKGGSGNLVEIQHSNGYTTYYMHLSKILVHNGQHVAQGERIGLVGMTGLATGPHLDFRIQHHGEFLNFKRLPLPPSDPVTKRDWDAFAAARDRAMAQMPALAPKPGPALAKNGAAAPQTPAR
jgi:murein DD-endopeptidase MepM/ murein hydrolase activator NlpD